MGAQVRYVLLEIPDPFDTWGDQAAVIVAANLPHISGLRTAEVSDLMGDYRGGQRATSVMKGRLS